jgi:heptosyltransferase-3
MAKPAHGMPMYVLAQHEQHLKDARNIALLMAPRLGDTLLMMTMARNLARDPRRVTIFGDYAHMLRDWFPGLDIRPSLAESDADTALADFDCVAQMHVGWPYALHDHAQRYFYYDAHVVVTGKGFIKLNQIRDYCRDALGLSQAGLDNGLVPPAGLRHRQHARRVAIHPAATGAQRCWAPQHFIALGHRLLGLGYEPVYILAPHERAQWRVLEARGLKIFQSEALADVAAFLHESGWFIGNESGIGHLASNVGTPTLTVTGRPTRTYAWRPGWSLSRIVCASYIPGGPLRDRLWRTWLRPAQVLRAFKRLVKQDAAQATTRR